jgi:diketogulonate reductase-like aldo/keto reductase
MVTLPNGRPIPTIGFGTWLLEEGPECYDAVAEALRVGYRHIDTASGYDNEASVGRAVRDSGLPREEIFVTSKLRAEAKSYEMALTEFELTMERIGLDYLDLYLVHCPWRSWDPKDMADHLPAENREIWKAMEEFLASGRVKAIGVSNYSRGDFENLLPICEVKPMANQIQWFIGKDVADTVAICREHDMVVEAYSPFAHGLIVNHPEIAEIAEKYGASAPQLCIRYLLQHGAVVLPKATSPAHIRANAETDFVISDADMELLDAMRDTDTHPDAPAVRWPSADPS